MINSARTSFIATLVVVFLVMPGFPGDKKFKTISNEQALEMLSTAQKDIQEHYFDPTFHGIDIEKRFAKAAIEIQSAKSQDEALLDVAGAIAALGDSHTRLIPPVRPYGIDYGLMYQAMGDACCFVTAVRPGSDAAQKGLKPGDQILAINGIQLSRHNLPYITYSYFVFPQSGLHLRLRSAQSVEREIVAMAKVIPGQEVVRGIDVREWLRAYHGEKDRSRYYSLGERILVWQLPDFLIDPADVDGMFNKARRYQTLILDLRGNPGGIEQAVSKFLGNVFQTEAKIGERRGRKDSAPFSVRPRGSKGFTGKLIVLTDGGSASGSEIFARAIQLEKRGVVLGDNSSGAVNEGEDFVHAVKLDASNVAQYSVRVAVRQMVMSDGDTLEGKGVVPDEKLVPTAGDLAAGRDPVLARALQIAGEEVTPEAAGKILPIVWPKERIPEIN